MKNLRKIALLIMIWVILMTSTVSVQALDYGIYLNSMVEFMQDMYYQGMTDEESLKQALKGMFGGLDDYSGYYDAEETEALNSTLQGNFVGIGASLEKDPSGIRIIKVYDESPALKAGLAEGDVITAVNGNSILNREPAEVAAEIRGEAGTQVTLTIKRAGEALKNYVITRDVVKINPVIYRIEGDIAYIRIDTFNSNTSDNFNKAMDAVDAQKIRKIMLDLRTNPGGFVDQAVEVARRIVPAGNITTLDFKSERMGDMTYDSYLTGKDYLIAVLVDENTASASEILASAVQDAGNGFLVGQNTYGKGIVQQMFSVLSPEAYQKYHAKYGVGYVSEIEWLSYYGVMPAKGEIWGTIKLTTGHYLTRKGKVIQGVGLKPDAIRPDKIDPNNVNLALIAKITAPAEPLSLSATGDAVLKAEKILRAGGYFKENPDKLLDGKTQEAIKRFQAEKKLSVTGNLDAKTCEQLNSTLDTLRTTNDQPYMKAVEYLGWF